MYVRALISRRAGSINKKAAWIYTQYMNRYAVMYIGA